MEIKCILLVIGDRQTYRLFKYGPTCLMTQTFTLETADFIAVWARKVVKKPQIKYNTF